MIRKFECRAPLARPLGVEAGQCRAKEHQEQARSPTNCDIRFRAQLTFDFLRDPVLLPTTDRRIGYTQHLVFISATQTCLAPGGTSRLVKKSSQPSRGSARSRGRAAILQFLW